MQIKTKHIGMFPVGLLVLPKEQINLHIYEPRFKQLINDCFAQNKPFGIPFVENGMPTGKGVSVRIVDITRFYPDGKMDIVVEGVALFKLFNYQVQGGERMYPTGDVEYIDNDLDKTKNTDLQSLYEYFLKEEQGYDPSIYGHKTPSIFEILKDIGADQRLKKAILDASSKRSMEVALINHLRLYRALKVQEESIQNRVFLN